jgi:hypothetical protein
LEFVHMLQCRPIPLREVDVLPPLGHINLHQPRYGRDTAVPGQTVFAVAIEASRPGQLARQRPIRLRLSLDERACMVVPVRNELDGANSTIRPAATSTAAFLMRA